ncbi:MAG TPA: hypothetical protein ENN69_08605 [Spirochaetia bacterium]|nr:hypothetical protein [Spirochaetia bacterium]
MQKLTVKQIIIVCIGYLVGVAYILTDQLYLSAGARVPAMAGLMLALFIALYLIIRPDRPLRLANSLAVILLLFLIPLYIVNDLLLNHDYTLRPILLSAAALAVPYLIGLVWLLGKKIRQK